MKSEGKTQDRLVAVGDRCAGAGYLGMADPQCAAAELPDAGSSQKGIFSRACWPPANWMPCEKLTSAPQVSGQLKTLHVNIGDKVKKDQLLGVIDPEQAQNQIKEVEATLMELRAQLNQARAESKTGASDSGPVSSSWRSASWSRGRTLDTAATDLAVKTGADRHY
ncbi:macrolide-specific efflux protein MacA [Klebsiella pneumoniae subsp. rhinoscleromatis]|nr:macrolide-specific efflux protein MacA [Klebsiella pneumoniae subsp. rhinoscleromatis]